MKGEGLGKSKRIWSKLSAKESSEQRGSARKEGEVDEMGGK